MTTEVIDRPHITDDDLDRFKKILNTAMGELLDQADSAVSELILECTRDTEIIDSTANDINRTMNLRLQSRKSRLIKKIKDALKRIEDGTYGYCDICGEEISLKRLEARPVTSKCIACKEDQERLEALLS
ncbi:TraR/DksA C4-type zinc finger protein [uncultured Desulfobacter sp.]|uniref:TraR/DksA family transcriptional regulator n=1 Tax=uncultured Desulfobacter sp. TaxID=240139 RepID=UPI0029F4D187|nr:TraR/DksA C4-type zinc finger protein [uncultured Desulfobacter sp.]